MDKKFTRSSLCTGQFPHPSRHSCLVLALILSFLFLPGCVFVRGNVGEAFKDEDIALIHKGSSTRERVAILLGAPIEILDVSGYEIFHYRRFDSKLGYFLFLSRMNITSDHVYVFFNEKGIVEELVYGKRSPNLQFQIWPFGE
jgi:outer membrane protein assembly factor BamE (lipoprotein component of BamABCDE complex)